MSRFLISWCGILCGFRGGWRLSIQSPTEGNNWAICGQEGALRMAFMIAAVGGKMAGSVERVWRLCARFGREGNGVTLGNKRAL